MKRFFVFLFFFFISIATVHAEITCDSNISKSKLTVGDIVDYTIKITSDEPFKLMENIAFKNPPNVYTVFESPAKEKLIKHKYCLTKTWSLVSYKTGLHEIPSIEIDLIGKNDKILTIKPDKVGLHYKSVAKKSEKWESIKDIFGPVNFPEPFYMLIGVVVVITLCIYLYANFREYKPNLNNLCKQNLTLNAFDEAIKKITHLIKNLMQAEQTQGEIYDEASWTLKHFIERKLGIEVHHLTTSELLKMLKNKNFPDKTLKNIRNIFDESDLVKFAKLNHDKTEIQKLLHSIKTIISEIENQFNTEINVSDSAVAASDISEGD